MADEKTVDQKLQGLRVAILVTDDFEQVELTGPRQALQDAGAETLILAPKAGQVRGVHHHQKGDSFPVDMTLDQADPEQFNAVLLPGGSGNSRKLREDPDAQRFVQQIEAANKPIGVICHGPWLLISAGLVDGRSLTSDPEIQEDIRAAGGSWLDQEVVTDRNWVSSRGPQDIPAFSQALLQVFPRVLLSGYPPVD